MDDIFNSIINHNYEENEEIDENEESDENI
jgi:hypothetical protein